MPVEIDVTDRCIHGCFGAYCGSRAIWRLVGLPPVDAEPETEFVFHACDGECDSRECWEDEEAHHAS
jgi:hypothetical protein